MELNINEPGNGAQKNKTWSKRPVDAVQAGGVTDGRAKDGWTDGVWEDVGYRGAGHMLKNKKEIQFKL